MVIWRSYDVLEVICSRDDVDTVRDVELMLV